MVGYISLLQMNIFDVSFKHPHNFLDDRVVLRLFRDEFQARRHVLSHFWERGILHSCITTIILSHNRISGKSCLLPMKRYWARRVTRR